MRRALLTLGVVLGFSGWLEAQVVVGPGHVFHYLRGYAPPPLDWNLLEFDPAAAGWDSGSLGIGYGDDDDVTILDDMPGNYLSVYLRTELEVPGVLEGFAWVLRARYDDGFVAYIDGQEVARAGLAGTPPAFDEGAQDHEITSPAGFDDSFPLLAATGILSEGAHVLAVQVHNSTLDSSDLSFYAELVAAPFIVSGIEPDRGPIEGGNTVSIHGQGFDDADPPLVTFGGTASGSVAVESVALLSVVVPPASGPGPVDVEIEDSRGGVILPGGYYYIVPGRSGLLFEQGDSATAAAGGDLAGEGTIEVWIRPEQGGFFTRWAVFAVEAAGGGDLFTLEYRSTQLRARYFPGGEEDRLTAGADLPVQNWHHIAFTYSPAGRRVYANGQLLASDDHFMQLPSGARFRLGSDFGGARAYAGQMSFARCWSVERSEDEIRRYRLARIESAPGLECYWTLAEGEGQQAGNLGLSGSALTLGETGAVDDADPQWLDLEDFPYLAVTSIEPASGPVAGGSTVTIYGGGFEESTTEVLFGGVASPEVEVLAPWELTAVAPAAGLFGLVDVTVRVGTLSVVVEGGYEYEVETFPLVVEGDIWHYFIGIFPPPAEWASLDFDAGGEGWDSGPTGIGYADGDDATDVSQMLDTAASLYTRIDFDLDGDPQGIEYLSFRIRFDDGFVAYLNGEEVARVNVLGQPPTFDELASDLHEIEGGAGTFDEDIDISSRIGLLRPGRNVLAVEVHNTTLDSSDLSMSAELHYAGTLGPVGESFVRGDADRDGILSVSDGVAILRALFLGGSLSCAEAADSNDDDAMSIADAVFILQFLFLRGSPPAEPFPEPGVDLSPGSLGCAE